eukprot:sb/3471955/
MCNECELSESEFKGISVIGSCSGNAIKRVHNPSDFLICIDEICEAIIKNAIKRVHNPSDFLICIDEICEAIIKVIPINNFRVFKSSTGLVSAFVEKFKGVLGDSVFPLTRALCYKIVTFPLHGRSAKKSVLFKHCAGKRRTLVTTHVSMWTYTNPRCHSGQFPRSERPTARRGN